MEKRRGVRLYNVIFPIWLLWLFPLTWLVILPVNFALDSLVVFITLKTLGIQSRKSLYMKCIFMVWGFGFLADFIGTIWMFAPNVIDGMLGYATPLGRWWYENLTNAVSYNPFQSVFSALWVAVAVLIAGLCIYWLNVKVSFKKLDIEQKSKKKLALVLAVFTAPYLFYLPTMWFY